MSASTAILRAGCLLLCLAPGSWQLSITEFVVPESVQEGEQAELQCRYSLSEGESVQYVKWWWRNPPPATGIDFKQIYQRNVGGNTMSLHNIEVKENDTDTILLLHVTPKNSGKYECEVSDLNEVRKLKELIVYSKGTGPRVNVTVVEDGPDEDQESDYLIECQAENVAPAPELLVTIDGEKLNISETISKSEDGLHYDIKGSVSVSEPGAEGGEVRCELLYRNSSFAHPPFVDTWTILPAGGATTTEVPADVTDVDVTPDSLQNLRDYGSPLQCSWILLVTVALARNLLALDFPNM